MNSFEIIADRVNLVRESLRELELDAFIVPHDDEHLGEYIPAEAERLAWVTGFTGSAGLAVLLIERAALFIDGRYTVQARLQAPGEIFEYHHLIETPHLVWLADQLERGAKVGFDPRLHSLNWFREADALLRERGIELVPVTDNPIDRHWSDRPAPSKAPVILYGEELAGMSSTAKREQIAADLRRRGLDAALLTQAESINWLLNLRGRDVERLPVVLGFAVLYANSTLDFFIDSDKLECFPFTQHVGNDVSLHPIDNLGEVLTRLGEDGLKVQADPATANAWCQLTLEQAGATLVAGQDPTLRLKACKNEVELAGMRAAHQRDAVAMVRFLAWLDRLVESGETAGVDEGTLADRLESFRKASDLYVEPSFDTISALGPNAAMCHYRHSNGVPRPFGQDGIYLVDSGGQYLDGTTDITRTVCVGEVDEEQKAMFTRVMQGHIALDQARFPRGTAGIQLDVLARMPLWRAGFNYDHGTGHGVGHFLSVHEGPQRIAPKGSMEPLQSGMVLSNEPGYYRENAFGIRCENLVVVSESDEQGEVPMLRFERLTYVPFDTRLIDRALLSPDEFRWLNEYHAEVRRRLAPQLDGADLAWLEQATALL
ncbi:aminopeptidase P family protein [Aeromonas simiae]|uniref:aminopeptidase P family protein n=1 Tax=Aeromonas simiae TaxID=218936 RepID=UPI00266B3D60|nr:aminopeptidase P family protein [Aeromonas simiae]MDO2948634.1 aminopeptidase P family protein [Aeromonas simiae]MDO2952046.1 aminopeptidase P family protein [Aeromonas simiae]MDO2956017.1 aminopeptidase P family protein [Aeromonas simiae]